MTEQPRFPENVAVEIALEALKDVLGTVDGVRNVRRLPLPLGQSEIAQEGTPAIVIDDPSQDWSWINRYGGQKMRVGVAVRLQLIAESRLGQSADFNPSTIRIAFVRAVVRKLVNEFDPEGGFMVGGFRVRNIPVKAPLVSALLEFDLSLIDTIEDDRTRTAWQQIILQIYPEGSDYKPECSEPI